MKLPPVKFATNVNATLSPEVIDRALGGEVLVPTLEVRLSSPLARSLSGLRRYHRRNGLPSYRHRISCTLGIIFHLSAI